MATRFVAPVFDTGPGSKPASGAKLEFFKTGENEQKDTFTTAAADIPNSNPVIADSNGVFPDIFISGTYKVILTDKNDVQTGFGEKDPIVESVDLTVISRLNPDTLTAAIADATLLVGDVLNLEERNAGLGGGGDVDVVLLSTVTVSAGAPAFGRIVAWGHNTGAATDLALVVRLGIILDIDRLGAIADVGAGDTDNTSAVQEAVDIGGHITAGNNGGSGTGTYGVAAVGTFVDITKSSYFDLKQNGFKRLTGVGIILGVSVPNVDLDWTNGTLDNNNLSLTNNHTINYNSAGGNIRLTKSTFKNNLAGAGSVPPTPNIDADLVDVGAAASVYVEECKFNQCSRQGISVVAAVPNVQIINCEFEDCYLFGIDVEPNVPVAFMYDLIRIIGNTFKNCGPKSETDFVFNSGGPFAVASAADPTLIIVRNLVVSDNTIISTDFLNQSGTRVEPFAKLDNYQHLSFHANDVDNLDRIILAVGSSLAKAISTSVMGNTLTNTVGNMQGALSSFFSQSLVVSNNPGLRNLKYSGDIVTIIGNGFKSPGDGIALKAVDTTPELVTIIGNGFKDCPTVIDTTVLSEKYVVDNNNSVGDTAFIGIVTNSTIGVANKYDGANGNGATSISTAPGVDFRMDATQFGYREAHNDNRTSSAENDIYYQLDVESSDTNNPGIVGQMLCIKDVANANAFGAWEWFSGLGASLTSHLYSDFSGNLLASRSTGQDNLQNLGSAAIRWATVFAGTGTIDTSDENLKQQVELLTDKEKAVAVKLKGLIRSFKFNDAVELKGDGARIHFGIIAQDVLAAFESEGLDAHKYAMFCSDEVLTRNGKIYHQLDNEAIPDDVEKSVRLGIRYGQLTCFIISVI